MSRSCVTHMVTRLSSRMGLNTLCMNEGAAVGRRHGAQARKHGLFSIQGLGKGRRPNVLTVWEVRVARLMVLMPISRFSELRCVCVCVCLCPL